MILVQTEDCTDFKRPQKESALNSIIAYIFDNEKAFGKLYKSTLLIEVWLLCAAF